VRARRSDHQLVVDVTDDGPGFTTPAWVPGHGLATLRTRLDALYGGAASLRVPPGLASTTTVSLAVPLP
jgi:signal transduction histidine kinase